MNTVLQSSQSVPAGTAAAVSADARFTYAVRPCRRFVGEVPPHLAQLAASFLRGRGGGRRDFELFVKTAGKATTISRLRCRSPTPAGISCAASTVRSARSRLSKIARQSKSSPTYPRHGFR